MSTSTNTSTQAPFLWEPITRWSARVLLTLLALFICIAGVFIGINWKDEELGSAAQALLREPAMQVPDQQNGFYILRQIDAVDGSNLLADGIANTQAERTAFSQGLKAYQAYSLRAGASKALAFTWNKNRCQNTLDNCLKNDLLHRQELSAQISANSLLLQRYAMMRALSGYQESMIPSAVASVPSFMSLQQASDMLTLQAAFEIADGNGEVGLQMLESNDKQLRLMLKNGGSLISKMAMQTALRKQARMLSEILVLYPALTEQYAARLHSLARPLTGAERSLADSYAAEARSQINTLSSLLHDGGLEEDAGEKNGLRAWLWQYTYHPHATANQLAAYWQLMIEASRQDPKNLEQEKKKLTQFEQDSFAEGVAGYLKYSYNPSGKLLIGVARPYAFTYIEKMIDTDAYLRLLDLQIHILQHNIPDADIAAYLEKTGPELRSPYDGAAMQWDRQAGQLKFLGHEKTASNPDGGKLNVIALH